MPSITLTPRSATSTNNGDVTLIFDWSEPTNVEAEDANTTLTNPTSNNKSCYLLLTDFDFASHLPVDATISGIQVGIKKTSSSGTSISSNIVDSVVQLIHGAGAIFVGDNKDDAITQWPPVLTFEYYGGSTDTWSWANADRAHVCDSSFGVAVQCNNTGAGVGTPEIDVVTITVWYDSPTLDVLPPCCLPPVWHKPEVVSYP